MNAKQTKILAALNAELAAALATKSAANDDGDESALYAACLRVDSITAELELQQYRQRVRKSHACPVLADLVANNID